MIAASVRLQWCNLTMVSIIASRSGSLATALPAGALREPPVLDAPTRDIESSGEFSGMTVGSISPTGDPPLSVWVLVMERRRFSPLGFCLFGDVLLAW